MDSAAAAAAGRDSRKAARVQLLGLDVEHDPELHMILEILKGLLKERRFVVSRLAGTPILLHS
jgi:hypothetical protein